MNTQSSILPAWSGFEKPHNASVYRWVIGGGIKHFWLSRWVNSTPYVADVAYWFRRRLEPLWRTSCALAVGLRPVPNFRIGRGAGKQSGGDARLSVTNICNAKCVFCAYPVVKLSPGTMTADSFNEAVGFLSNSGFDLVDLTPIVGDPLIDPNLEAKVATLVRRGFRVRFTTNAILLDRAHWILTSGIEELNISLPHVDPENYRQIYKVDKGEQVLSAIESFLAKNKSIGEPLRVRLNFRNSVPPRKILRHPEFARLRPFLSDRIVIAFTALWENWGGSVDESLWTKHMRRGLYWNPKLKRPCRNLSGISIRHDGKVRLCGCFISKSDVDDLTIGHIQEGMDSLQIKANGVRGRFMEGDRPECCRKCSGYKPE